MIRSSVVVRSMTEYAVVIAGGGPTGLMLAGELALAGVDVSIVELVELTFLIGYINMLNLFNNALGVRYNGEYGLLRSAG